MRLAGSIGLLVLACVDEAADLDPGEVEDPGASSLASVELAAPPRPASLQPAHQPVAEVLEAPTVLPAAAPLEFFEAMDIELPPILAGTRAEARLRYRAWTEAGTFSARLGPDCDSGWTLDAPETFLSVGEEVRWSLSFEAPSVSEIAREGCSMELQRGPSESRSPSKLTQGSRPAWIAKPSIPRPSSNA